MNPKFKKAIILAIGVVLIISVIDILFARSGLFGTFQDYTNGNYTQGLWDVFFKINLMLISILPIAYYYLVKKDLSESVGLFLTSFILWFSGLADFFYFIFQGLPIPAELPWLTSIFIAKVAYFMTATVVTKQVLLVSIACGFGISYLINIIMEKLE